MVREQRGAAGGAERQPAALGVSAEGLHELGGDAAHGRADAVDEEEQELAERARLARVRLVRLDAFNRGILSFIISSSPVVCKHVPIAHRCPGEPVAASRSRCAIAYVR